MSVQQQKFYSGDCATGLWRKPNGEGTEEVVQCITAKDYGRFAQLEQSASRSKDYLLSAVVRTECRQAWIDGKQK